MKIRTILFSPIAAAHLLVFSGESTIASPLVHAGDQCTIVMDVLDREVILKDGQCDGRVTPASTFKIALSLMAYDRNILTGQRQPLIDYRPGVRARKRDRKPVDPTTWMQESILWYSREITSSLGFDHFSRYVREFNYGNLDVEGNATQKNGLTNSWVSSSLQISPAEQVSFLHKLLDGELPVSDNAVTLTKSITPIYSDALGRRVSGKTGSGWTSDARNCPKNKCQLGWFVGWMTISGRDVVFARMEVSSQSDAGYMGLAVRSKFLTEIANYFPLEN